MYMRGLSHSVHYVDSGPTNVILNQNSTYGFGHRFPRELYFTTTQLPPTTADVITVIGQAKLVLLSLLFMCSSVYIDLLPIIMDTEEETERKSGGCGCVLV